ncbi:stage II sporulation protein M [Candidatus Bathyarchaeota archaeon]|nr:stage II sporulation protein M [Candidatus Bathyarchaeota archaeon]
MMFLQFKLLLLKTMQNFKHAIYRNILILKVTSITFFIVLLISIIFTISIYNFFPEQINNLSSITESLFNYEDIPAPYTWDFFSFIFLNNSGHFWNPIRMLVWIPFLGPLLLVFEIILNSGLIGVIAVMVGINEGITYPIIGLVPHGIVEIPAFLIQLSSIIL